ncbi:MAG: hypothetical protein IB618_03385 [Candidatus Pacearchaeota archaeon]|nr:MAG: hypothetical protein IB618_03385 [Candidatus Pacearchaeota archaeon]
MENQTFWAFLVIALVVGFVLGMAYTNSTITGKAIWDVFKVKEPTTPAQPDAFQPATTQLVDAWFDGTQFPHCETTFDFNLDSENSVFFLEKCFKAVFVEENRRKEVTLHGTFFDTTRQEFVAHIEFKDFLGSTLCFEEDIITAVEDIGFAVDVLEITLKSSNAETVEAALVVIPDNFFEEFCFTTTDPNLIEGTFTDKKYVIDSNGIDCKQGFGRCAAAVN